MRKPMQVAKPRIERGGFGVKAATVATATVAAVAVATAAEPKPTAFDITLGFSQETTEAQDRAMMKICLMTSTYNDLGVL